MVFTLIIIFTNYYSFNDASRQILIGQVTAGFFGIIFHLWYVQSAKQFHLEKLKAESGGALI